MDKDIEQLRECLEKACEIVNTIWERPKVVSEDGPDKRKARLVLALKNERYPIKSGMWIDFCGVVKDKLYYLGRDTHGNILDFVLDCVHSDKVDEGLVDTLLEMVVE